MSNFIYYLFGVVSGKAFPLLFSFILATRYGNYYYTNFVGILLYANFLSSISIVSYSPIILSTQGLEQKANIKRSYLFSILISMLGGIFSFSFIKHSNNIELVTNTISIICYSLGISFTSVTSLYFNAHLKNKIAAIIIGSSISAAYALSILIIIFKGKTDPTYVPLIISLTLMTFSLFFARKYFLHAKIKKVLSFNSFRDSIPFRAENIQLILFISGLLLSHNILFKFLDENFDQAQVATYGVGYQLFSIGIFIPGVMANYLIPKLSAGKTLNIKKTFLLYFSFGVFWFLFVMPLSEQILRAYKIQSTEENMTIFMVLQGAVLVATINAFINQIIAAKQQYQHLALSSMIFLAFTLFYIYYYAYNKKIEIVILSLIFGYILVSITSVYSYKRGAVHERK